MKRLLLVLALTILVAACASTSPITKKTDQPTSKDQTNTGMVLPTEEKAFVKAIRNFDRKAIIAQWGEPAKADDVKIKGTNKIIASIWHYHYVNTDENGNYLIDVELPKELITTYGKTIEFKHEMKGTAEIITEDLRLIERFFYQLKNILK